MGKRKKSSRKPTGPRKREPLPTSFRCVFCNNETSVSVKIDKKAGIGTLVCKSCGQNFQHTITPLDQPVDVYAEWIDACDLLAKEQASNRRAAAPPVGSQRPVAAGARAGLAPGERLTQQDREFIDDDDADDAEGNFVVDDDDD